MFALENDQEFFYPQFVLAGCNVTLEQKTPSWVNAKYSFVEIIQTHWQDPKAILRVHLS